MDLDKQKEKLIELSDLALNQAKKQGFEAYINAEFKHEYAARFSNSEILQNYKDFNNVINVTLIYNDKQRVTSRTNVLTERSISDLVTYLSNAVKLVPPDPIYPGLLKEPQEYPKLTLNDPKAQSLQPEDIVDKIEGAIVEGEAVDKKVEGVSGNFLLSDGYIMFKSTSDLELIYPSTNISSTLNINAISSGEESRSNSDFGSRIFEKLNMEQEAKEVADRAVKGLNAKEIDIGEYEVIFDHQAASSLLFFIAFGTSSRMVIDRRSYLIDKIGQQVFDEKLTIENDPHNLEILSARPIDAEGLATQKFPVIENGVLKNYSYSRLDAARVGAQPNGCAFQTMMGTLGIPFALNMHKGSISKEKMISEIDKGLLITNLHYANFVNPPVGSITGMSKDGLFIIENGEIIGSAKNMRFTDEIPRFMKDIDIGQEIKQPVGGMGLSGLVAPIRAKSFKFTSKTEH